MRIIIQNANTKWTIDFEQEIAEGQSVVKAIEDCLQDEKNVKFITINEPDKVMKLSSLFIKNSLIIIENNNL
jgi:hypothetical protein